MRFDLLALSLGLGTAIPISWDCVISVAAAKMAPLISDCLFGERASMLSKGIAMSLPWGNLSHSSRALMSTRSRAAVGCASCTLGMVALVNLSRGSRGALRGVGVGIAGSMFAEAKEVNGANCGAGWDARSWAVWVGGGMGWGSSSRVEKASWRGVGCRRGSSTAMWGGSGLVSWRLMGVGPFNDWGVGEDGGDGVFSKR